MDEKGKEYIRKCVLSGIPSDIIRNNMVRSGYDARDVEISFFDIYANPNRAEVSEEAIAKDAFVGKDKNEMPRFIHPKSIINLAENLVITFTVIYLVLGLSLVGILFLAAIIPLIFKNKGAAFAVSMFFWFLVLLQFAAVIIIFSAASSAGIPI